MSENFFRQIPAIHAFEDIADSRHFHPVPRGWSIIVTDVQDSTEAIRSGRYRDVNLIGAAAITAILEIAGEDMPFVFGGDGATILVPTSLTKACTDKLSGLTWIAKQRFNLVLRAAIYPIEEIVDDQVTLEVARYELIGNRGLAEFKGGGVSRAETFLKTRPEHLIPADRGQADGCSLNRLSCRWQSIRSRNGQVVSLLISPRDQSDMHILGEVIKKLQSIAGGNLNQFNPVAGGMTGYKSIGQCLLEEARLHPSPWCTAYLKRAISILISVPLFKWGLDKHFAWSKNYVSKLQDHADYRKMDDALKLVLDCSAEQITAITAYLESLYNAEQIFYGLHCADSSQMTCYVESTLDQEHFHFIDGGDGGYATASLQLKDQLKLASQPI